MTTFSYFSTESGAARMLPGQAVREDADFNFTVPLNVFSDEETAPKLNWRACVAPDRPLPFWLVFNPSSRSFWGSPPHGTEGDVVIRVEATDQAATKAFVDFTVTVMPDELRHVVETPIAAPLPAAKKTRVPKKPNFGKIFDTGVIVKKTARPKTMPLMTVPAAVVTIPVAAPVTVGPAAPIVTAAASPAPVSSAPLQNAGSMFDQTPLHGEAPPPIPVRKPNVAPRRMPKPPVEPVRAEPPPSVSGTMFDQTPISAKGAELPAPVAAPAPPPVEVAAPPVVAAPPQPPMPAPETFAPVAKATPPVPATKPVVLVPATAPVAPAAAPAPVQPAAPIAAVMPAPLPEIAALVMVPPLPPVAAPTVPQTMPVAAQPVPLSAPVAIPNYQGQTAPQYTTPPQLSPAMLPPGIPPQLTAMLAARMPPPRPLPPPAPAAPMVVDAASSSRKVIRHFTQGKDKLAIAGCSSINHNIKPGTGSHLTYYFDGVGNTVVQHESGFGFTLVGEFYLTIDDFSIVEVANAPPPAETFIQEDHFVFDD